MQNEKEVVAMAVAAIAEELDTDCSHMRVVSFSRVYRSGLERYIEERGISYHKYRLEDEAS